MQVTYACALGPDYTGSFQTVQELDDSCTQPLIAEDRLIFGLNAQACTQMTIARLKSIYNKTDSKSIAKYVRKINIFSFLYFVIFSWA